MKWHIFLWTTVYATLLCQFSVFSHAIDQTAQYYTKADEILYLCKSWPQSVSVWLGWCRWNICINDCSVKVEKDKTEKKSVRFDLFTSITPQKHFCFDLKMPNNSEGYLIINQSAWLAAHHTFPADVFHPFRANSPMNECTTYSLTKSSLSAAVSFF